MDGEATLLGPSWTQKRVSSLGDISSANTARRTESNSPSGFLGADGQGTNMAGLASQLNGDQSGQPNADPSSVLALQQSLQRLYGSLGHLGDSTSRASLHSSLEEQQDNVNGSSGGMNALRTDAETGSHDDLFIIDQAGAAGSGNGVSSSPPHPPLQMSGITMSESRSLFIRGIEPSIPDEMIREYLEVRRIF